MHGVWIAGHKLLSAPLWTAAINLQQQAKEREERLAFAEYELRIAKEDLAQLQVTLLLHLNYDSIGSLQ